MQSSLIILNAQSPHVFEINGSNIIIIIQITSDNNHQNFQNSQL
jgi:hypothetical protein